MKIDVSKIEGFDTLTESEKLQALLELDVDITQDEKYIKVKKQLDIKTSELAQNKTKISDSDNQIAQLTQRLDVLEKEKQTQTLTNQYLSLGYSKDLAEKIANAQISGNLDEMFKAQKEHLDSLIQSKDIVDLNNQPIPNGQQPNIMKQYKKINEYSYDELLELSQNDPQGYEQVINGE